MFVDDIHSEHVMQPGAVVSSAIVGVVRPVGEVRDTGEADPRGVDVQDFPVLVDEQCPWGL